MNIERQIFEKVTTLVTAKKAKNEKRSKKCVKQQREGPITFELWDNFTNYEIKLSLSNSFQFLKRDRDKILDNLNHAKNSFVYI